MKKTQTSFGKTRIYHAHPSHNDEVVLLVPGFSETATHFKKLIAHLGKKGIDALTFSPPRRSGTANIDPIQRQSNIIFEVVQKSTSEQQKIVGVAHSFGSAALLRAAMDAPERFSQLILMQPIGLAGEHSLADMLVRVGKKTVNNHVQAWQNGNFGHVALAHIAAAGVLARQPALAVREAKIARNYDAANDISAVVAKNIPVHVVVSATDEMFDRQKLDATYNNIATRASSYTKVSEEFVGHDTFWVHPHATADLVSHILQEKDTL